MLMVLKQEKKGNPNLAR